MIFLATTRNKDSYYALPQDQRLALMQETIAFVEKHRQAGACKHIYFAPDVKGSTSIWEIETYQQRIGLLLENPLWTHQHIEIQPLLVWESAVKGMRKFDAQPVAA